MTDSAKVVLVAAAVLVWVAMKRSTGDETDDYKQPKGKP